ncbi:MAG: T9SS type A sorting domain-containing protein [Bacteroidetes bacterium]|nr:T9SS type A sorting domain-containing protein [Bacteroidota bacterium]
MKKIQLLLVFALSFSTLQAQPQNWFQISSGTTKNLNTIHFPSPWVGYIGGDDSLLLKTTDGGLTWNSMNPSGINFLSWNANIINLQFLTDSIGYLTIGPYATSYKTVDGGLHWTSNNLFGNNCYNHGLFFFDPDNGFIGGSGCFQGELISKLTAGIWSQATMNSSTWDSQNMIVDIDFFNTQLGLAASTSGLIFRTTDGGFTWDSIPSNPSMNPLTSVLMVNDTLAYAGYQSLSVGFGLYISTDGGLTWAEDLNSATFFYPDFLSLHQSGSGEIFSGGISQGGIDGLIFNSPGDIISWNFAVVDQQINSISSNNDSTVFAVGDSGYIVVNKILTGLLSHNAPQLVEIKISPNPTNQYFRLEFPQHINTSNITTKIYSLLGELVQVETNATTIDIRKLAAGVYVIEAFADGFVGRSKLVVE